MNEDFLQRAKNILKQTVMDCYFETDLIDPQGPLLEAQLYWQKQDKLMRFRYTPEKAPCRVVWEKSEVCVLEQVQQAYPEDRGLTEVNACSYVGILKNDGCGHLGLLGPQVLTPEQAQTYLQLLRQLQ